MPADRPSPQPAAARGKGPWFWRSPYLLLVFTVLAWSGNFVVGRAVHASVPPIALAFWRWFGALVLVVGFAVPHLRRDWPVLWRHRRSLLLLSAFGVAAFNTCIYLGLQTTTAINALLLQSVMPVAIFAASFALFGERVSLGQLVGLLVSLVGVVVIISHGDPLALAELGLNQGDAWVVAAVIAYALYSALLRRRPAIHPLSLVAATFAIGTAILLPLAIGERLAGRTAALEPATFLAIGYVAVFPSLLAYLAYNRGVELIGANRAGQFVHLMPAFGSLLAVLFLGETFHLFHAAGLALIAAGIVLSSRKKTGPP